MTGSPTEPGVDLLGPIRVHGDGEPQTLTRRQEIGVLALLALHAGSSVPAARLIDLLWPDDPPRTATKTLQGYVKRVRGLLAGSRIGLTHSGPAGYVLDLPPARVDAVRFESLVAAARTGHDDADRVLRLDAALALWRGEPFGGCELDGLRPFRKWLEQLRSGARVERAAAGIRRGITIDSIGTVRALVTEEPTNERLWLHLVAALYLSGNPVAALTTTDEARRELDERVGVTPGPELLEIEHRIGVHDDVEGCYARLTGVVLRPGRPDVAAPRPNAALSLPIWAGELIGRDGVVDEIVRLIDDGGPVVTVAGPGGLGKTRCAVEAARRASTRCEGLIDLSGITAADELAVHLAGSLGAPGRDDAVAAITDQLAGRRCCVLLDNAEQVDGAAAVIGRLARSCASVIWLVTSRTELGLDEERVVRLTPLAHESTPGRVSPAARLLTAAASRRGVALPVASAPVIDRVTAAIGGIPLALELAACQLQTLDPAALLRSLDEPLATLVDERQPVDRHRSMRACFQLGLDRLSPDAVTLMIVLSGRTNGAPYDDLVAAWPPQPPLPGVVAELVEVGFAATAPDPTGGTRVTQLPLVRAFGREQTAPGDGGAGPGRTGHRSHGAGRGGRDRRDHRHRRTRPDRHPSAAPVRGRRRRRAGPGVGARRRPGHLLVVAPAPGGARLARRAAATTGPAAVLDQSIAGPQRGRVPGLRGRRRGIGTSTSGGGTRRRRPHGAARPRHAAVPDGRAGCRRWFRRAGQSACGGVADDRAGGR